MFNSLLIANRGEIACRIASTARRLGIHTIAIYSDADAHAKHVKACDSAVYIGGSAPQNSYLRSNAIVNAALAMGAQAIHPGYGFLAENDAFAQATIDAGLRFVGPPASAIAAMGNKAAAKALMAQAGIPLIPGYHGDNQDPLFLQEQANAIGYPVIIKASAGGGGKGMRIVNHDTDFLNALSSCQREARSSFNNDHVLIERYLSKPRHIEIQIFGDHDGHYVYLFERDCSVQRRHQKVIEEAPAPGMTSQHRHAMGEAAIAAARKVGYVGAGTVEFIVEPDGSFYFMEMNTRIQVEHPVTEMITGIDLVEWQLRIADGQPLPKKQNELFIDGHAFEARLYAENPITGFLPSTGLLDYVSFPEHAAFAYAPLRIDSGIEQGDTITAFYDPMIAKLIVHGKDREQALTRMTQALTHTKVIGVHTNLHFLSRLLRNDAFIKADIDTHFIEHHHDTLLPPQQPVNTLTLAAASAAILIRQGMAQTPLNPTHQSPSDPWDVHDGWRVNDRYQQSFAWVDNGAIRPITVSRQNTEWQLHHEGVTHPFSWSFTTAKNAKKALEIRIILNNKLYKRTVLISENTVYVFGEQRTDILSLYNNQNKEPDSSFVHQDSLTAPMPGKIIAIAVQVGDKVVSGQALLTLEAMKMEHTISAPHQGVVKAIFYREGEHVSEGIPLLSIEKE